MGVYIKMEMPKDGGKLYMIVFSDGKACASYKPFEWHEVVSLPPHGRLGDLDELKERATKRLYASNHGSMAEAYYASIIDLIDSAPTIIPASGGNEGEEHTMDEFMYGQEGNPNDGSM